MPLVQTTSSYISEYTAIPAGPDAKSGSVIFHATGGDGVNSDLINNAVGVAPANEFGEYTPSISSTGVTFSNAITKFSGYSAAFNGTTSLISAPWTPEFDFGYNDFTIEFWYYTNTVATGLNDIISFGRPADNVHNGILIYRNAGSLQFYLTSAVSPATWDIISNAAIGTVAANTWYHIAITKKGNAVYCFLNGALTSRTVTSSAKPINFVPSSSIFIGGKGVGKHNGYLSNLRITRDVGRYTEAFSVPTGEYTLTDDPYADNVVLLMTLNNSISNAVSLQRSQVLTSTDVTHYRKSALKFSSSSFAVSNVDDYSLSRSFTIDGWVYPTANVTGGLPGLVSISNTLRFGVVNGHLTLTNTDGTISVTDSASLTLNAWTHIACEVSGTSVTFYVNGEISSTAAIATPFYSGNLYGRNVVLGKGFSAGSSSTGFEGYAEDLRITNGIRYGSVFSVPSDKVTYTDARFNEVIHLATNNSTVESLAYDYSDHGWSDFISFPAGYNPSRLTPENCNSYSIPPGFTTSLNAHSDLTLTGDAFTIEAWIHPVTVEYEERFIFSRGTTNIGYSVGIFNQQVFFRYGTGSAEVTVTAAETISAGSWYHIAVVRSSTAANGFTIYVNGVAKVTATVSQVFPTTNYTAYINGSKTNTKPFTGYVSDLRISTSAVYTSNFAVPTEPLSDLPSTVFSVPASNDLSKHGPIAFNCDIRQTYYSLTPFSPYENYVNITDDSKGSINCYNSTSVVISDTTQAASSALRVGASPFTVEAWVMLDPGNGTFGLTLFSTGISTNQFSIEISCQSITFVNANTSLGAIYTTIPTGKWTHVAVVREATTTNKCIAYVNGVRVGAFTYAGTVTTNGTAKIAGSSGSVASSTPFSGNLRDFRFSASAVYTANFSPTTEILSGGAYWSNVAFLSNFNGVNAAKAATDISNYGNVMTFSPAGVALSTSTPKFGTTSVNFSTTAGKITTPASAGYNFGTADFTVEGWFKVSAITNTGGIFSLLGSSSSVIKLAQSNATLTATFTTSDGKTVNFNYTTAVANTWYHIWISRKDGMVCAAINDTPMALADTTYKNVAYLPGTFDGSGGLVLGDSTTSFIGFIDDFRITNGVAHYTHMIFTPAREIYPVSSTVLHMFKSSYGGVQAVGSAGRSFGIPTASNRVIVGPMSGDNNWSVKLPNYSGTGNMRFTAHSDFEFAYGDFGVECFFMDNLLRSSPDNFVTSTIYEARNDVNSQCLCIRLNGFGAVQAVVNNNVLLQGSSYTEPHVWRHVVVQRTNGTMCLFVDGKLEDLVSYTGYFFTGDVRIGYSSVTSTGLDGYVNNLRITKGAAPYYINNTIQVPTKNLEVTSNTVLLTAISPIMKDYSGKGHHPITSNAADTGGSVRVVPRSPFKTADASNNYHQVMSGTIGSRFTRDITSILNNGAAFTIEGWFWAPETSRSSPASTRLIYNNGANNTSGTGFILSIGRWAGYWSDLNYATYDGGTVEVWNSGQQFTFNFTGVRRASWNHYAITFDPTLATAKYTAFINGVVAGSSYQSNAPMLVSNAGLPNMDLQTESSTSVSISNICRYSTSNLPNIYSIPEDSHVVYSIRDRSPFFVAAGNFYSTNPMSVRYSKNNSSSFVLNLVSGAAEYLSITTGAVEGYDSYEPTLRTSKTIEMWAKQSDTTVGRILIQHGVRVLNSAGFWALAYYNGTSWAVSASTIAVSYGAWDHICLELTAKNAMLYVNGVYAISIGGSVTPEFTDRDFSFDDAELRIGCDEVNTLATAWKGMVKDIRLTSGAPRLSAKYINNTLKGFDSANNIAIPSNMPVVVNTN